MKGLLNFWRQLKNYDRAKVEPWVALRNATGLAVALIFGAYVGSPALSLYLGLGALVVAYSDGVDSYQFRAGRMWLAAVLSSAAALFAALVGTNVWMASAVAVIWAFVAGLTVVLASTTADVWSIGLVMYIIFAAHPIPFRSALIAAGCTLLGGALQIGLAVLRSPKVRFRPERRALVRLLGDIANLASADVSDQVAPPGSGESTIAQQSLSSLNTSSRDEALLYRSLLTQSERIRLSVLSIHRSRKRLQTDGEWAARVTKALATTQDLLRDIAETLREREKQSRVDLAGLKVLELFAGDLQRATDGATPGFANAVLDNLRFQITALMGQIRAAADLATATTSAKLATPAEIRRHAFQRKWKEATALIRANFTFRSSSFRHAVRLAVCVAIGELCERTLPDLGRGYWVPMTIAIVLKPDYAATLSRSVLRIGGTLIGLTIATVLIHYLTLSAASAVMIEASLTVVFMFLLRSVGAANYGLFAVLVTGLVVALLSMAGAPPSDVIYSRGLNTCLGGLIAMAGYFLWPTWERTQIAGTIARMIEAYSNYLLVVETGRDPEKARLAGRVARSAVETSLSRWRQEPGPKRLRAQQENVLVSMSASSNRFAHAVMALEVSPPRTVGAEAARAQREFFNGVETTMSLLARAMRGAEINSRDYPDVRGLYEAWAKVEDWRAKPVHLFEEDVDRLANATNTLREQVIQWRQLK